MLNSGISSLSSLDLKNITPSALAEIHEIRDTARISQQIAAIGAQIASETDPSRIAALISDIEAFEISSPGKTVSALVAKYVGQARQKIAELVREEGEKETKTSLERTGIYAIEAHETLANTVDRLNLWTDEERKKFMAIDPKADHKIARFDDKGKVVIEKDAKGEPVPAEDTVKGAELRDAVALVTTTANKDKLDEQGKKELNKKLHEDEQAADTPEEITQDADTLKKGILKAAGKALKEAKTEEEKKRIEKDVQTAIEAVDKKAEAETKLQQTLTNKDISMEMRAEKTSQAVQEVEAADAAVQQESKKITDHVFANLPTPEQAAKTQTAAAETEKTLDIAYTPMSSNDNLLVATASLSAPATPNALWAIVKTAGRE